MLFSCPGCGEVAYSSARKIIVSETNHIALDKSTFVAFLDVFNTVAMDTDKGGRVAINWLLTQLRGTRHTYSLNSIRVIKKPPKWGQGSEVVSVGISRPYLRW